MPAVPVVVTNPDGQSASLLSGFTYNTGGGDPHAYYNMLAARSDCFAAYSWRSAAQVAQYRSGTIPQNIDYLYPNDPDPRRQDAAKIVIPVGAVGTNAKLDFPSGTHYPQNLFAVYDLWFGAEWNYANTGMVISKATPIVFGSGGLLNYLSTRVDYQNATLFPGNQPPGGPFVCFPYVQTIEAGLIKTPTWWQDGMSGFPRLRLPCGVPSNQTRGYTEGLAADVCVTPPLVYEGGFVAERWTRTFWFFERAPGEDWTSTFNKPLFLGKPMKAYKLSVWVADAVRAPFLIIRDAIVAGHPDNPVGFNTVRSEWTNGGGIVNNSQVPLVAYTRNWAFLHGTSRAAALGLLQQPTE